MGRGAITDETVPSRPFERRPLKDLPLRPRRSHPYYEAQAEQIVIASRPFGRIRVHVVSYGPRDASPLLLVHGLMTSSYSWRYMFEQLGDRFHLVAPDLPGCGRSEPAPHRRHGAHALATFVGELQRELGIDGCAAVGSSLGGYLCMLRALAEPGAFGRLVAIDPPAVIEPRLVARHLALRVPGAAAIVARVVRHEPARWAHRHARYHDATLSSLEEANEYGDPLARTAGARAFTRYLAEALSPHTLCKLARELERRDGFPIPLSLISAREDPTAAPPKLHALVPDAELHRLERSSRFVQVDAPERLARLVAEFVAREV